MTKIALALAAAALLAACSKNEPAAPVAEVAPAASAASAPASAASQ